MEKNVGGMDKNIRMGAGAVLLVLGLLVTKSWLLTIIGVVLLVTGFLNFCPAYKLIGMNTNK